MRDCSSIRELEVIAMKQNFLALGAGLAVGLLFSWLRLPLPAPPIVTGIVGAFGVFLGSVLFRMLVA
jgi:XapX domain-containing protein